MAKRISEKEVASVWLLALELSEDEITVLASALTSLFKDCDDSAMEAKSAASRDEVKGILKDLHARLKPPSQQSIPS